MDKDKINSFLQDLVTGHANQVEIAKRMLDGKENIVVTFRQPPETPVHKEPGARAHVFRDLDGFLDYLQIYADTENIVVLADSHSGRMEATLDELQAKGRETVAFQPMPHPVFAPWRQAIGRNLPIKKMAEFVLVNRAVVITPDPKLLHLIFSQVKVNASVEALHGSGKNKTNGLMVTQTIKGKIDQQVVEIPETITIRCPMFVGDTEPQDVAFDVCVDAASPDETVYCTLTSPDVAIKTMCAIETMLTRIKEAFSDGVVGFGDIDYEPWQYLK